MNKLNLKSKLSLKSAIFGAMMICGSMIGTSEVMGALNPARQQENKWNVSIKEILDDCGFSNDFANKLSGKEKVTISTSIEDYKNNFKAYTDINLLDIYNPNKFAKSDLQNLESRSGGYYVSKREFAPVYSTQLYAIVSGCMNELGITGEYSDCTKSKKDQLARLLQDRINCVVVETDDYGITLKINNSYIIKLDITNSSDMMIVININWPEIELKTDPCDGPMCDNVVNALTEPAPANVQEQAEQYVYPARNIFRKGRFQTESIGSLNKRIEQANRDLDKKHKDYDKRQNRKLKKQEYEQNDGFEI